MSCLGSLGACFRPQDQERPSISLPVEGSFIKISAVVGRAALPLINNPTIDPPNIPRKQHKYERLSDGRVVTERSGKLYLVTSEGLKLYVLPPKQSEMQKLQQFLKEFE